MIFYEQKQFSNCLKGFYKSNEEYFEVEVEVNTKRRIGRELA